MIFFLKIIFYLIYRYSRFKEAMGKKQGEEFCKLFESIMLRGVNEALAETVGKWNKFSQGQLISFIRFWLHRKITN